MEWCEQVRESCGLLAKLDRVGLRGGHPLKDYWNGLEPVWCEDDCVLVYMVEMVAAGRGRGGRGEGER